MQRVRRFVSVPVLPGASGEKVTIAVLDTGERVIIMSS